MARRTVGPALRLEVGGWLILDISDRLSKLCLVTASTTPNPPGPNIVFSAAASAEERGRAAVTLGGRARLELASDGSLPSPIEFLLGALAACQVLTYEHVARQTGINFDALTVEVSGSLDPRGFREGGARPAVDAVTVHVAIRGPESAAAYEELARQVDERCPVHATLEREIAVTRELAVA
jgi:uncharacterized OsmC-like protein